MRRMNRGVEVVILGALALGSVVLGWVIGTGGHNRVMMLFFSLMAALFFLAMFRPRSW